MNVEWWSWTIYSEQLHNWNQSKSYLLRMNYTWYFNGYKFDNYESKIYMNHIHHKHLILWDNIHLHIQSIYRIIGISDNFNCIFYICFIKHNTLICISHICLFNFSILCSFIEEYSCGIVSQLGSGRSLQGILSSY